MKPKRFRTDNWQQLSWVLAEDSEVSRLQLRKDGCVTLDWRRPCVSRMRSDERDVDEAGDAQLVRDCVWCYQRLDRRRSLCLVNAGTSCAIVFVVAIRIDCFGTSNDRRTGLPVSRWRPMRMMVECPAGQTGEVDRQGNDRSRGSTRANHAVRIQTVGRSIT
jgi:hypothetical protein